MDTRNAYQVLEPPLFLCDNDLVQPATPEDVETRRRIIDFVHEIETARFMLAMRFFGITIALIWFYNVFGLNIVYMGIYH